MRTKIAIAVIIILGAIVSSWGETPPEYRVATVDKKPYFAIRPDQSIVFYTDQGVVVGTLIWKDGELDFYGKAKPAAKNFIHVLERYLQMDLRARNNF